MKLPLPTHQTRRQAERAWLIQYALTHRCPQCQSRLFLDWDGSDLAEWALHCLSCGGDYSQQKLEAA